MKIAACLIVKDSAATIEKCLNSIRPFVDEINVYDTGSTDDTVEKLENAVDNWMTVCSKCGDQRKSLTFSRDGDPRDNLPKTCVREDIDCDGDLAPIPLAPIRVKKGEWRDDFSWARQQSFDMASDDVDW